MEECKICGRKNPIADANFCYYCGAALTNRNTLAPGFEDRPTPVREYENGRATLASETTATTTAGQSAKPFSKWKCFGLLCLILIPVYGWLILFGWCMMTVFSPKTTDEQKEVVKGVLLFFLVLVILILVLDVYLTQHPEFMDEMMRQYGVSNGT